MHTNMLKTVTCMMNERGMREAVVALPFLNAMVPCYSVFKLPFCIAQNVLCCLHFQYFSHCSPILFKASVGKKKEGLV